MESCDDEVERLRKEVERLRLTHDERVAIAFLAHADERERHVRRTRLEFKATLCGLLERIK